MTEEFKACGKTVGHGDSCQIGYLCGTCSKLYAVQTQLTEARSALTELMELLPQLVRIADRQGFDISEQPWIDKAQTYIDIYEGRINDLQT